MGDLDLASQKPEEVHALVLGAAPFREHAQNPAGLIVSALPPQLTTDDHLARKPKIEITLHSLPEPWRVSYSWVKEHIPPMLFPPPGKTEGSRKPRPNYDIVLFVGMAAPRPYYSIEAQAHRDGYEYADVDGRTAIDDDHWSRMGAPETLPTSFDMSRLYNQWRENVPEGMELMVSNDAGHYLCDYIYYTGLCEYWLQNGKDLKHDRPVIFLHVPGDANEGAIQKGITVTAGLIKAMAAAWISRSTT